MVECLRSSGKNLSLLDCVICVLTDLTCSLSCLTINLLRLMFGAEERLASYLSKSTFLLPSRSHQYAVENLLTLLGLHDRFCLIEYLVFYYNAFVRYLFENYTMLF